MPRDPKTVIIGLDGVPFGMIRDFAEMGVMPHTAKMISQGVFKKLQSTIPEVSSVAWSSIITGKNPGQHGIFGFMDLFPNSYKMRFPNYNDLKAAPFWDQWQGKSVIVNVPATYPVREMNGVHISGFVSVDFQKSVYPSSLIPKLKELDYRLDVDSQKAHQSIADFLIDLDKTLNARIRTYQYLWDNEDWQIFMLVFTGTDRLMHFLWNAYEQENGEYRNEFWSHFRKIDEAIGEIKDKLNDDDSLIMLSDHGFERLEKDVYVNFFLKRENFLTFNDGEAELGNISEKTKAFALDPARIYVNQKGKYPCGNVDSNDKEKIISDLINLFESLKIDNRKAVKEIYRKEQVYSGPHLDQAPDLILVSTQGFNLKASIKVNKLTDKGIFTGKHTQDTAFLLLDNSCGKNIVPESPQVYDVQNIIERVATR